MTLEENIELVKWAYFEPDDTLDINYYTLLCFPELSQIKSNMSLEEKHQIITQVVTDEYNQSFSQINDTIIKYNNIWTPYNDKYYQALCKYLNIDWPKDKLTIDASIGLAPVFPRELDTYSFSLGLGVDDDKLKEVIAQESLHFLWFWKWKQLYPNCPKEQYDSPYPAWKYSEMVTDPILNSDTLHKVLSIHEQAYDSFYSLKDSQGNFVMNELAKIYNQDISIEEKITQGYEYVQEVLTFQEEKRR